MTDVQFSPEGDVLASSSKDKTVRLWIPSAKGEAVSLKGHMGAVRSVRFSRDTKHLITASDDKLAKIWSLPSRKFMCSLTGHTNWVRSAEFNNDASKAVTGSDDKLVKLWDVETHRELHTFYDHNDCVNQVMFTPGGSSVAACSADNSIKMWDTRSHTLIQHYPAHADSVTAISIHPSGNYMLSSSKDSALKLWDLREGRLMYSLQGHSGAVNAAAFSNDGHFFSTGGADQLVMVWKSNLDSETVPVLEWGQKSAPVVAGRTTPKSRHPAVGVQSKLVAAVSTDSKASKALTEANAQGGSPSKPVVASPSRLGAPASPSSKIPVPKRFAEEGVTDENSAFNSISDSPSLKKGAPSPANSTVLPPPPPLSAQPTIDPAALNSTLGRILGQLDLVTKTIVSLEHRLTISENRTAQLLESSPGTDVIEAGTFDEADD